MICPREYTGNLAKRKPSCAAASTIFVRPTRRLRQYLRQSLPRLSAIDVIELTVYSFAADATLRPDESAQGVVAAKNVHSRIEEVDHRSQTQGKALVNGQN